MKINPKICDIIGKELLSIKRLTPKKRKDKMESYLMASAYTFLGQCQAYVGGRMDLALELACKLINDEALMFQDIEKEIREKFGD